MTKPKYQVYNIQTLRSPVVKRVMVPKQKEWLNRLLHTFGFLICSVV